MSPSVEEAVRRVDAQILHYYDQIQDLKLQRNTLIPISQLPAEVLGKIFHEVRGVLVNGHESDNDEDRLQRIASRGEPSLKWISVSHVSRHWRNVAINDPSLWTDFPLKNAQWTRTMLARSRMATIPAITLKVEELDKRVVAALTPHIPRVSSLVIPNMARDTLKQVLLSLPATAPTLKALSISTLTKLTSHNYTTYYASTSPLCGEAVALPDNVLCHTPKLQHLQLNSIIVKPDSPLLYHLTSLSMSGIPVRRKPSLHQFRTMLKSASRLKRLTLTDACPSTQSNEGMDSMAPIQMRHLEYMDISETIPRLTHFFRIISATHLLKGLNVNIEYTQETAADLPRLFAALNQPYLHPVIGSSTDVRRLEVMHPDGPLVIRASKISVPERSVEPDKRESQISNPENYSSPSMTLYIETPDKEAMDEEEIRELTDIVLLDLFQNMTWTGLGELDIASLFWVSPQVLASTFGTVPHLRIITADCHIAPCLIKALNHQPYAQSNTSESMTFSFPDLQHIGLHSTKLTLHDTGFKGLLTYLEKRHKYGRPVISLKFSEYGRLAGEDATLLEEYVEHINFKPLRGKCKVVDDYSPYNYDWYL